MLKHYTLFSLLLALCGMAQGQEYCNYDTATYFDMGTGSTIDDAEEIITQADGWMVGLGSSYFISSNSFRASLVRFDVNQNLDPSFGVNGRVKHTWSARNTGVCIDVTSDNKYIIGGYQAPGNGVSSFRGYVARLNSDGSVDEDFATAGSLDLNQSTTESETIGVQARDNGTIRAIMHSDFPKGFYMAQITSDGELDTNFNSIGYSFSSVSQLGLSLSQGDVIFTADSGAIVIDYALVAGVGRSPLIFKFDKNGEPDTLFNETGLLIIDEIIGASDIKGIVDDAGNLFVNTSTSSSPRGYIIYKFDAITGAPIESFGVEGRAESSEQTEWHDAHGLIMEPSTGNIIGYGTGGTEGGTQRECTVWTVDAETGTEQTNCGSTDMWDLQVQFSQGYRAATIDPVGNIQYWGNGGGLDSTSGDGQGGNFLIPAISLPSGIDEFNSLEFSVYPNPARDKVILNGLATGTHTYVIYDQVGAQVSIGSYQDGIDLSYLSQGLYTLRIQTDEGAWGSQRFVIE